MAYRGAGPWYSPLKSAQINHEHKGRAQRTVMTSISGIVNRLLAVLCLCSALRRLIHCNGWLLRVHTRRGNTLIRLVWERYIKDQLLHESQQDYLDMSPTRTLAGMQISVVIAGKQSMWIVVTDDVGRTSRPRSTPQQPGHTDMRTLHFLCTTLNVLSFSRGLRLFYDMMNIFHFDSTYLGR